MYKLFLILIISGVILFASPARAFSVAPLSYRLTVDPGNSQIVAVTITNNEAENQTYKLLVLGMSQDEAGHPFFGKGIDTAESWVAPDSNSATLAPGQNKKINFFINVPVDSQPGTHYLGLAAETVPDQSVQATIAGRLVVPLVLQVAGVITEAVSLDTQTGQNIIINKKWKVNLEMNNTGTVGVALAGRITVRDWGKREIFSQVLVLGNQLLPGAERRLAVQLPAGDNIGWPGLYEIRTELNYGLTQQKIVKTFRVWYLPPYFVGGLGLIGLLVSILLVVISRKNFL